ncbi:MAG: glycosyltransferase [Lachnospiraceae bacterium]|nr:glycosyltransferase [Lachnospiraceae bacterium]
MLLSVIVPCFNEEAAVPLFYEAITKTTDDMRKTWKELETEFLFIDDGSTDKTLSEVRSLREKDERVRFVSFSRNFGKEAGIYAGLENSRGDYVVIMDVDMQDPPSLLPEMFSCVYEEGFDSAATRRVTRKGEPAVRSFFARQFYKLINRISETEIMDGARDYRIMTRQMADAILSVSEYNRFTKGIYGWVGFRTKWIEFENVERIAGETKWSFWKLFQYALEGIMAFSTTPLSIATLFGILMSFMAFLFILVIIARQVLHLAESAYGWSSLVCIILLISGIQLFCIGIVGQYLSKTYLETKKRPLYIAKEKT